MPRRGYRAFAVAYVAATAGANGLMGFWLQFKARFSSWIIQTFQKWSAFPRSCLGEMKNTFLNAIALYSPVKLLRKIEINLNLPLSPQPGALMLLCRSSAPSGLSEKSAYELWRDVML